MMEPMTQGRGAWQASDAAMAHITRPVSPPTAAIAPDCRHYLGDRPCPQNRLCAGCAHYQPFTHRICIIKLGALGDVIRTLCVLPELRRQYPQAQITWISSLSGCHMIAGHAMLDRVLAYESMTIMQLAQESFDLVLSLDKEPGPCALAMSLFARRKLGMGLSGYGVPIPLNPQAHPYFHLGLSDELKFRRNRKCYPQLIYEALGWEYQGQGYELPRNESSCDRVRLMLAEQGWKPGEPMLGINVGSGQTFANKMWPAAKTVELIQGVSRQMPGVRVVLLGGPEERRTVERLRQDLDTLGMTQRVLLGGTGHDEPGFVAAVDACDVVFSGDTMAMHVAIALGKGVVALLGPTCEQEIELFGRGEKLVARVDCAPCYKRRCDHQDACMGAVSIEEAVAAIGRVLVRTQAKEWHRGVQAKAG